jgi:hypothetical protein
VRGQATDLQAGRTVFVFVSKPGHQAGPYEAYPVKLSSRGRFKLTLVRLHIRALPNVFVGSGNCGPTTLSAFQMFGRASHRYLAGLGINVTSIKAISDGTFLSTGTSSASRSTRACQSLSRHRLDTPGRSSERRVR